MRKNLVFIFQVMGIHIATYLIFGIIFSNLFHYEEVYSSEIVRHFMRPMDSESVILGPFLFQIVRGILFGIVLLILRPLYSVRKHGWWIIWAIIVIVGIVNTPGAAPSSIEGVIYTQLPISFHLLGFPEILLQTLCFSILSYRLDMRSEKKKRLPSWMRNGITALISGFLFSLFGLILAMILSGGAPDLVRQSADPSAFLILGGLVLIVFLILSVQQRIDTNRKYPVIFLLYYLLFSVFPVIYNGITNSIFQSYLPLLLNLPIALLLLWITYQGNQKNNMEKDGVTDRS